MAYIKLGPTGTYFGSTKLGIFLTKENASYVNDSVLESTLANFLLTGFIVRISKHEFDNIKVDKAQLTNIPLQFVGVNQPKTIEPVLDVTAELPLNPATGDRYIVWHNATGPWLGRKDYIAEFNGSTWDFTEPQNGWIVPVYQLGTSTNYIGTYPSGRWSLDDGSIIELQRIINTNLDGDEGQTNPDEDWATKTWVNNQLGIETQNRIAQDNYIIGLINQLSQNIAIPPASQITITDAANYYTGTNVEAALQEIGLRLLNQGHSIDTIETNLTNLTNLVNTLLETQSGTSIHIYNGVTVIQQNHYRGYIPIWQLYEYQNPGSPESSMELQGVLAMPTKATVNELRFEFDRVYNLVMILNN